MDLFSDHYITNDEGDPSTSQSEVKVVRRVYHQEELNKDADYQTPRRSPKYYARKLMILFGIRECIFNSVPIRRWLPKYKFHSFFVGDLIAGATMAVMHIPQGMAYALLSEVPPIHGLYMAFFPPLIYVIFGTSPHISIGTFAVACLMSGKVVSQHASPLDLAILKNETDMSEGPGVYGVTDYTPTQVVTSLCLTVAIIQMLMWILRMGALSTLLSEPLVSGFTTAASFHVLISQLKDLFGIKLQQTSGNYKNIYTIIELVEKLPKFNWVALTISLIACTTVFLNNELLKPWLSKRCRVPVPIELLVVVAGTVASRTIQLKENYHISLVGHIPTGLPAPQAPPMDIFGLIFLDACTITMVTYTISMSMALIFAAKEKYEIDANQELLALGASNMFGSFFGCAPICASLSRSYIGYQAGSKTPISTVISALLILFVLLWIGPFFEELPRCVLASIIIVSLKNMFIQVVDLRRFWKLSKLDALVWLITFLITILINIDVGLGAGLLASLGTLFLRSQKPYTCLLGRVKNTDLYLDIKRYRAAEELQGIKIFHYCGGLSFASKNLFRSTLYRKIGYLKPEVNAGYDEDLMVERTESLVRDPTLSNRINCVIVDATALSYVDAPGVKSLVGVHQELAASCIRVLLTGANGPVLEMIQTYNSLQNEENQFNMETFPTVHDAVVSYQMHSRIGLIKTEASVTPVPSVTLAPSVKSNETLKITENTNKKDSSNEM